MDRTLNTLYCAECGSSNIAAQAWVDPNTKDFIEFASGPCLEADDCWCNDCAEHVELCTLKELWNKFADVPINDEDEIQWDFLFFHTGDSRFDVWHWFDEHCPNGLAVDLMGETPKSSQA